MVCWLDIPAETKKIFKDVKRLLVEKLRPSGFLAFAEFQARKLRLGETALLYVHELKRLLEDAIDADSQDRILFQQLLLLRANTADAVSRARLLMTVSHQASVPRVASVNAGKDSQTEVMKAMLGTSRNRCHR